MEKWISDKLDGKLSERKEAILGVHLRRCASCRSQARNLEKIHKKGVKTFAFIGPLLPGNPEKLIERLFGVVDKVYIDKMNYMNTMRTFYIRHGLKEATTDEFFNEYRKRLINELKKKKLKFEVLF